MSHLKYLPRMVAVRMILLYQKTISFDHGVFKFLYPYGYCRFRPTCSEYAIQAIGKYGFFRGGFMAMWRVLRCNPWSRGGYDPVK